MIDQTPALDEAFEKRKSVLGIRMTVLYFVLYGGFVALSVFRPTWMGARGVFGLNLAVSYGIGLILAAVILALVYNLLCRVPKIGPKPDGKEG
jgi:uncharacterized membrane protein (DUF485 family)